MPKELAKHAPLTLDPPDFDVSESDPLWAFRLPVHVPLSALEGVVLKDGEATFTYEDITYRVEMGQPSEQFRVLVRGEGRSDTHSSDDNSDNSDDNSDNSDDSTSKPPKAFLTPASKPFSQHFNILECIPPRSETQLAPLEGPPAVDHMRHAYAHVPQRRGLKRRWMPLGATKSVVLPPLEKKYTLGDTTSVVVTPKKKKEKKKKSSKKKAKKKEKRVKSGKK